MQSFYYSNASIATAHSQGHLPMDPSRTDVTELQYPWHSSASKPNIVDRNKHNRGVLHSKYKYTAPCDITATENITLKYPRQ